MAYTALNLGYIPTAGYEYTATTDSSADWPSVPNETYFYDKTERQVYYKDANGGVYGAYAGSEEGVLNTFNISSTQWSKTAPLTDLLDGQTANGLTFFRDDLYASELTLGGVTGTGYATASGLTTSTTGSGTGMTVDIVAVGGNVTSVTINNPGFGYTLNDVITILQGGSSNDETATITDLASDKSLPSVAVLTIDNPGTGYSTGTAIEVSGGTGVGLLINIDSVGGSGEITAVSINDKGDRYTNGDSVTVEAGSRNATLTLTCYEAGTTVYDEYNIAYGLSVILTGTSGTANIRIGGSDYLATFNTDLATTAQDWVDTYGDTLRALNIRPFALSTGSTDGRIRFCAPRATLLTLGITNVTPNLNGTVANEFTGSTEPAPDHLLVPYIGKPYFGKRIQHYIRVNFNVNTGAVKYATLQLRRYENDSVIGSGIPIQRYDNTSGITGQQHVFETYTASPTDSFVLGGFYFALENESGTDWEIEGSVGILVQNIFSNETSF
jgi:hypothetical protein